MKIVDSIVLFFEANKKYHFYFFLLLTFLLTSFMMLTYNPLCSTTDPYFHHNRILVLMEAIQDGRFPFYLDYNMLSGYGYFVKAFYPDLILIPYALLGNATSIAFAYDFYIFSFTVFSGLTMYLLCKRLFNSSFTACTGGLLYSFSFYKIFLTYYYASLPYVIILAILPLVFLGLYEIIKGNYKKWYILAFSFALILNTHLITAILTFLVIILMLLFLYKDFIKQPKRFGYLVLSAVFCLLLSSYYILPMLEQMGSNTFYYQTNPFLNISNSGLSFAGIFEMLMSTSYNQDYSDFYPKIGYILTGTLFLRIFVRGTSKSIKFADISMLAGFLCLILCTVYIPWTIFPFNQLTFIQFPWRILIFTVLFFSVSGSIYISALLISGRRKVTFLFFLTVFLILFFKTNSGLYHNIASSDCISEVTEEVIKNNVSSSGLEYLPSKVPSYTFFSERGDVVSHGNPNTLIKDLNKKNGILSFNIVNNNVDRFELPLTYYKGYKAVVNDKETMITQSKNGLIEIDNVESGSVRVWYDGTFIQKISTFISMLSFLLLCVYIFWVRKRKNA